MTRVLGKELCEVGSRVVNAYVIELSTQARWQFAPLRRVGPIGVHLGHGLIPGGQVGEHVHVDVLECRLESDVIAFLDVGKVAVGFLSEPHEAQETFAGASEVPFGEAAGRVVIVAVARGVVHVLGFVGGKLLLDGPALPLLVFRSAAVGVLGLVACGGSLPLAAAALLGGGLGSRPLSVGDGHQSHQCSHECRLESGGSGGCALDIVLRRRHAGVS